MRLTRKTRITYTLRWWYTRLCLDDIQFFKLIHSHWGVNVERYRSGHNGAHSKCVWRAIVTWVRIPPAPPNKKGSMHAAFFVLWNKRWWIRTGGNKWLTTIFLDDSHLQIVDTHCLPPRRDSVAKQKYVGFFLTNSFSVLKWKARRTKMELLLFLYCYWLSPASL